MQRTPEESQLLESIFRLVQDQQAISTRVSKLIESLGSDIGKIRETSEKIAILANRVDRIERQLQDNEERRNSCVEAVAERFVSMDQKREENKDRVTALEKDMTQRFATMKDNIATQVGDMKEKAAYSAGKYGAITALIVSIVTMILGWILNHPHK